MQFVVDWVVSKLSFFPPRPATYGTQDVRMASGDIKLRFDDQWAPEEFGVTLRLQHVEVEAGERMLTMHLKHFNSRGVTLLFSHGNAVDIGLLRDHFLGLCCELHVDVFAYEYSGYGTSTGVASEASMYRNIGAAFTHLTQALRVPASHVVLYGQSIGSAPTCQLAARTPGLRGVILHSPFLSGARVFFPGYSWYPVDAFDNCHRASAITAPVLIMHGLADEIIDIQQAMALHRKLGKRSVMPLFITGAGHNNLECYTEFTTRLREFLVHVQPAGPEDEANRGVVTSWVVSSASTVPPPPATASAAGALSALSALDRLSVAAQQASLAPKPTPQPPAQPAHPTRATRRGDMGSGYALGTYRSPSRALSSLRPPDCGECSPPMVTCRQELEPLEPPAPAAAALRCGVSGKRQLMASQQAPPKLAAVVAAETRGVDAGSSTACKWRAPDERAREVLRESGSRAAAQPGHLIDPHAQHEAVQDRAQHSPRR